MRRNLSARLQQNTLLNNARVHPNILRRMNYNNRN